MRQRIIDFPWDIFLGSMVILLFGLVFGAAISGPGAKEQERPASEQQHKAQRKTDSPSGTLDLDAVRRDESDLRAQWTMAIGTLALLALTLVSVIVAISTSNRALRETKRSVDAYVVAERAYVIHYETHINQKARELHWSYKNVGRTFALLSQYGHDTKTLEKDETIPIPGIPDGERIPVSPMAIDEIIRTWKVGDKEAQMKPCPDPYKPEDLNAIMKGEKVLILQGFVEYETMERVFRHVHTVVFNPESQTFFAHPSRDHNFTVEITPGVNGAKRNT